MSEPIRTVDSLLAAVKDIDSQAITFDYKTLLAIRKWALARLGIDYMVGDKVRIKDGYQCPRGGWWPNRDCLVPGATAVVKEIDFNAHYDYWYADIVLDREFSVYEADGVKSYNWHGPASETPPGMMPPSEYDQKHHPHGRKHYFSFDATQLEKASDHE